MSSGRKRNAIPTVQQIIDADLTQIAAKYWAPFTDDHLAFDPKIVADIYTNELLRKNFALRQVMLLEFSQYLECFLWPNYNAKSSSVEHLLSILVMVNEKFRDRAPVWHIFSDRVEHFNEMFLKVLQLSLDNENVTVSEQTIVIMFLDHSFNSLEVEYIRCLLQKLVALPTWICLDQPTREFMLEQHEKLSKYWKALEKRKGSMTPDQLKLFDFQSKFLFNLLKKFIRIVLSFKEEGPCDINLVRYCERFLEMLIDLESVLSVRRFFNVLLRASGVEIVCALSPLNRRKEGKLFNQLLDMLKFYIHFEIDDLTGEPLTQKQMIKHHRNKMSNFQNEAFKHYREELRDLYLPNIGGVDSRSALLSFFSSYSSEKLLALLKLLNVPGVEGGKEMGFLKDKKFLLELLISHHERRPNQLEMINELPLYPTESIIWDENLVPGECYTGNECVALNKLGLQFLTMYDYLLRNFNLFRLESAYEIRQDIEDALFRLKPWKHETEEQPVFGGWARMALPITNFSIVQVGNPHLGENCPSVVKADVQLTLNMRPDIRGEWLRLRKHDVCFLITVRPVAPVNAKYDLKKSFKEQIPIVYVRGCEIEGMLGPDGKLIEDAGRNDGAPSFNSDVRTFRVWLDCNQYRDDLKAQLATSGEDVYSTFNVLVRRKPKENNFKAVLDSIRQLMNTNYTVPDWLLDVLLGYGSPDAAHYSKMPQPSDMLDFRDTFVSLEHCKQSFANCECVVMGDASVASPPFRVDFAKEAEKVLTISAYQFPKRGPSARRRSNRVPFTQAQVEAIRGGMQLGLTLIVGPPGTGKTDVAAQIISNLYHNWPNQRTLIITHSNQALNNLFEKIMALDIDELHMLRLGHGEEELETEKDFSKYGRVNYALSRRLQLLQEVERLQRCLGCEGDAPHNCETASYFFFRLVRPRWTDFLSGLDREGRTSDTLRALFPFGSFFANANLFDAAEFDENMAVANECMAYVKSMFEELEEFRVFELLRSGRDRVEYLILRQAKIIAMTCTHAALRRKEFVDVAFHYDNVLMEEAAQILEIETFIPLMLQNEKGGKNPLKRWIMIGDHYQLPPVIKNQAFQKYSNMEQSLFTRLVRLGVPLVNLDQQGRARGSLADLYNWRYPKLTNLPHVEHSLEYQLANAGFLYEYQLIDVQDFEGVGESSPTPHFYQNLAEAEYAVAIFMYMRLLGYPADKISILTTYNGQRNLIKNVVQKRCANNPLFGNPSKITTVDKYQGQQNDQVILSLVRTAAVGHLRDLRRLVVAMSRARFGLYILARVSLFRNCFELTPVFNMLCSRPQQLMLIPTEVWNDRTRMVLFSQAGFKDNLSSTAYLKLKDKTNANDVVTIEDMPHMVKFVHEYYKANAESLKDVWFQASGMATQAVAEDVPEEVEAMESVEEKPKELDIQFEILNE